MAERQRADKVVVDATSTPSATFADFNAALSDSDRRYAVYDHEYINHGRKSNKLFFVMWIPQNSHPGYKMAYTHAKSAIKSVSEGFYEVSGLKKEDIAQEMNITDGTASEWNSELEDD
ncbi:hypothetical protein PsorP6_013051 [Peronosclerospora sorghi]|uniref:Uncharacterized protein n=1 Tax=Peronosclerospora sorghi TaxID=230839 RepID=A0ACC0WFQ6_9STRA|nr:hypothetical protein PsorP6_013051 [Peronosclerospora sorghi]